MKRISLAISMGLMAITGVGVSGTVRAEYVDVIDYPGNGDGWEAFLALQGKLEVDFDQICGDSFCEGDYSDYRPLRYRCSVNADSGVLGECVWTFGASEISVEAETGKLLVDTRTWRCASPITAGTTLAAFYQALDVDEPLYAPLPGNGTSIYDGLIDCL